jgi:hypothetical protein
MWPRCRASDYAASSQKPALPPNGAEKVDAFIDVDQTYRTRITRLRVPVRLTQVPSNPAPTDAVPLKCLRALLLTLLPPATVVPFVLFVRFVAPSVCSSFLLFLLALPLVSFLQDFFASRIAVTLGLGVLPVVLALLSALERLGAAVTHIECVEPGGHAQLIARQFSESRRSLLPMFPPEIERCVSELRPLQAKLSEAEQSSHASLAEIYEWERECAAISDEMRVHIRRYGFPDAELGEAVGDAALRMGVLMALLRRAPEGAVPRSQLLERIGDLKGLYEKCQRYARRANPLNRQMTINYTERLKQLDVFEQNIDKFLTKKTNPFTQDASKASGGCYIATAVYGSYDDPSVLVLRRFRDDRLQSTAWGRAFICAYYAVSPSLARHFSSASWLNRRTRSLLDRLVRHLQH